MKLGDAEPTTVLTKAQREFAESYLAAVTGSEIDHYKWLLHPSTRACMNAENADYFNMIFQRRVKKDSANPRLSVGVSAAERRSPGWQSSSARPSP